MADGSIKPIKMIQKGDRVLGYHELSGKLEPAEVLRIHVPYTVKQYRVINEEMCSPEVLSCLVLGTNSS